jgi:hypothetical protein
MGGNVMVDHERVGAYLGMIADPDRPEQGRVSPDEDVIAEPGVTLTMEFPGTTQGDIVEHHAPVTDYRGFADDDAGAMIEEEATPNARCGVDLDSSRSPSRSRSPWATR